VVAEATQRDLLLLIDADADDEYWWGYEWPVVSRLLAAARGIQGLIESVCDLDFVAFTTPGEYVKTHPPVGVISIGQDTADGSFDGFSSWAEKWSNHRIWTGIERSRILELQTRGLMSLLESDHDRGAMEELLEDSREARLRSLSTTHFGLSTPIINRTRLRTVSELLHGSVEKASRAFERGVEGVLEEPADPRKSLEFSLLDYVRGVSTDAVSYSPKPSRALVRLPLGLSAPEAGGVRLVDADGKARPAGLRSLATHDDGASSELLFVSSMEGEERRDFRVGFSDGADGGASVERPVRLDKRSLENGLLTLRFDQAMQPVGLGCSGIELADGLLMRSAVNYSGRIAEASSWETVETGILGSGIVGFMKLKAEIPFRADGEKRVALEREFLLASGLPYLYATTRIVYPETRSDNFNRQRARALEREYDGNWREVMPCEIRPALFGDRKRPLRVWKHNHLGHVSRYDLDYGAFSRNQEMDSFNNHVTHGWVAVTDGEKGMLVAQTAEVNASLAFCPMRTRVTRRRTRVFLNPFGSYHGKQLHYPTAFTGLGKVIGTMMGESLDPLAPSYNGQTEEFSQLIAPYSGDDPPEQIRNDAEAFAYPYAILSRSKVIQPPRHRRWTYRERRGEAGQFEKGSGSRSWSSHSGNEQKGASSRACG
jgi:hypothetical protein